MHATSAVEPRIDNLDALHVDVILHHSSDHTSIHWLEQKQVHLSWSCVTTADLDLRSRASTRHNNSPTRRIQVLKLDLRLLLDNFRRRVFRRDVFGFSRSKDLSKWWCMSRRFWTAMQRTSEHAKEENDLAADSNSTYLRPTVSRVQ